MIKINIYFYFYLQVRKPNSHILLFYHLTATRVFDVSWIYKTAFILHGINQFLALTSLESAEKKISVFICNQSKTSQVVAKILLKCLWLSFFKCRERPKKDFTTRYLTYLHLSLSLAYCYVECKNSKYVGYRLNPGQSFISLLPSFCGSGISLKVLHPHSTKGIQRLRQRI